jgi:hypothetical protein
MSTAAREQTYVAGVGGALVPPPSSESIRPGVATMVAETVVEQVVQAFDTIAAVARAYGLDRKASFPPSPT